MVAEVAALEETVTEAMEAAVGVAAIEEAAGVADTVETATEATVAVEAAEAMAAAVGVAVMAETATEAMVAARIRVIKRSYPGFDRKNTVKPCNGWPTSKTDYFCNSLSFFFLIFKSVIIPSPVNSADTNKQTNLELLIK